MEIQISQRTECLCCSSTISARTLGRQTVITTVVQSNSIFFAFCQVKSWARKCLNSEFTVWFYIRMALSILWAQNFSLITEHPNPDSQYCLAWLVLSDQCNLSDKQNSFQFHKYIIIQREQHKCRLYWIKTHYFCFLYILKIYFSFFYFFLTRRKF